MKFSSLRYVRFHRSVVFLMSSCPFAPPPLLPWKPPSRKDRACSPVPFFLPRFHFNRDSSQTQAHGRQTSVLPPLHRHGLTPYVPPLSPFLWLAHETSVFSRPAGLRIRRSPPISPQQQDFDRLLSPRPVRRTLSLGPSIRMFSSLVHGHALGPSPRFSCCSAPLCFSL